MQTIRFAVFFLASLSAFAQQTVSPNQLRSLPTICGDSTHALGVNLTVKPPVFTCQLVSIPAGMISFVVSGSCPSGWTEVTALNGKAIYGTIAANMDVGNTVGSSTITPAGTVSQPTFTGDAVVSTSVSGGTPSGTVSQPTLSMDSYTPAGTIPDSAQTNFVSAAGTDPANTTAARVFTGTPATLTGTVSQPTFTGNALTGHTHTTTATGTISQPAFTGNAVSPQFSGIKAIFCQKN